MRNAKIAAVAFVLFAVGLLLTGRRVLIWETAVLPGEAYNVPGWGRLDAGRDKGFICTYFTGRSVKKTVYWSFMRDECPFITKAE